MHFQRLRLSGFKSFVETTDLLIEPGLTGIVGPNGCGKSNLLEALRWVMGASSAKAMRGEAMDDVIFGGTAGRPSRNHAEVSLQIDNAQRNAPAVYNDSAVIEVARRITRGAGSSYKVNGAEARAKDVQLLFADASTGANSPSLVRQGQISELIAAKPSNRRRILEEAAGVSGLHTRRHEADLRLKAAEANLLRLDDVLEELSSALTRLKREARAAERYKRLAAEIRQITAAALLARYEEAHMAHSAAAHASTAADVRAAEAQGAVAHLTSQAANCNAALPPLRDDEMAAAAVLQRLLIERERASRAAADAQAEAARWRSEGDRLRAEVLREGADAKEASAAVDRLSRELAEVEGLIAGSPERLPKLENAAAEAETRRAAAFADVERLASAEAAAQAAARAERSRLEAVDAAARAAAARSSDARSRLARADSALEQARRAAEPPDASGDGGEDARLLAVAQTALEDARGKLAQAEEDRARAQAQEQTARDAARAADDRLRRLKAEAQGLIAVARPPVDPRRPPPVLDHVTPQPGYEAALAAALSEDELDAGLDAKAAAFWSTPSGRPAPAPAWPPGARPLTPHVQAPPALSVRLAFTAVVERADGPRLAETLAPGAQLVSVAGDLWRWDGFHLTADAPKAVASRLQQKARLAALEAEIAQATPLASAAQAAQAQASAFVRAADAALVSARDAPRRAEGAVAKAREAVELHARAAAAAAARMEAARAAVTRAEADRVEAQAALDRALADERAAIAEAEADRSAASDVASPVPPGALAAARVEADQTREAAAAARSALDLERRAREGRLRRREGLARDVDGWRRRASMASERVGALDTAIETVADALAKAVAGSPAAEARAREVDDAYAVAEARRSAAADALAAATQAQIAADQALRAAESEASAAREARAGAQARLEAASERLEQTQGEVLRVAGQTPAILRTRLAESASAIPQDPAAIEQHLVQLEKQRDAIGPVNLRAEEEAGEQSARLHVLAAERADLSEAVTKLRSGIDSLNAEGRERVLAAFEVIDRGFRALFTALFEGGEGELRLVESDDPLEAGLEIYACPPGKKLAAMSLMSGGEQALTATALIFAVFLANPSPVCVLDEVDAPLDDANVDRFCRLLDEMRTRTDTRFLTITHNPVTMSRMDRLFGVTMSERGVSQLVSVDLRAATALAAE